jgi:hypothetical protein
MADQRQREVVAGQDVAECLDEGRQVDVRGRIEPRLARVEANLEALANDGRCTKPGGGGRMPWRVPAPAAARTGSGCVDGAGADFGRAPDLAADVGVDYGR